FNPVSVVPAVLSFPARRSPDLRGRRFEKSHALKGGCPVADLRARAAALLEQLTSLPAVSGREDPLREFLKESLTFADEVWTDALDRKSTRLNSSHVKNSYADFS